MDINKIKKQIEYYFSDSNYAKDKFMNETAIKNKKCIPISIILTFKRMNDLNATVESVKEAVKDSTVVEVVDDCLKKIETKEFLEYKMNKKLNKRIVYMSGFPLDKTLDDIWELLDKQYNIVRVNMVKDHDKVFKGACFVEFSSEEDAKNILNAKIYVSSQKSSDERVKNSSDLCDEAVKKMKREEDDGCDESLKKDADFLVIISKEEYLQNNLSKNKNDKFIEKVKNDFILKLYKYECFNELDYSDIKKLVRNCAFVDAKNKILRMKYCEDWTEKEFEEDNKKIKLTKLSEEEARNYVKGLVFKKVSKSKRKIK